MTSAINQPSKMPMTPPSRLRNKDSTRNWTMISRLRAPTALRRPISRVRSVTEIMLDKERIEINIFKEKIEEKNFYFQLKKF